MSGPFATATEFCEWTNLPVPSDLARIQSLLDSASALVRGYRGQILSEVTGDVITVQPGYSLSTGQQIPYPAAHGEVIFLPQAPVTAVSSVVVNAVSFTAFAFTEAGVLYRTDGQAWLSAATITYSHGYPQTSDEFKRIRMVCMQAAKRAYTFDGQNESIALGGFPTETVGFPMDVFLTEGEKAALPNPRMVAVG